MQREQAERMRTTLASIADAVAVADADGQSGLNPVAEALTGWPAANAIGRPLQEVFRTVNAETLGTDEMPIAEVLRDGSVVRGDGSTMLVARDGSVWPVEHSSPLKHGDGSIGGVVLVFRDITDRRRAEAKLAEQTSVAEALHRIGSRLAAELDLQRIIRLVVEETVGITRAAFGAFYYDDVEDEPGSGESPPPADRCGFLPLRVVAPVLSAQAHRGGGIPRRTRGSDRRRQQLPREPGRAHRSRSTPEPACPATRSVMAVPVVSRSGRVLGAMVLGHTIPACFDRPTNASVPGSPRKPPWRSIMPGFSAPPKSLNSDSGSSPKT